MLFCVLDCVVFNSIAGDFHNLPQDSVAGALGTYTCYFVDYL